MSKRNIPTPADDLARQRAVLEPLFLKRKRGDQDFGYTVGGYEAGMSYDMFRRYVTGVTLMPTSYYPAMARVFGISLSVLRDALIPSETFDARAYLRGRLQEADIDAFMREHGDAKPEAQRVAADGMLELAAEQRRGDPLPAPIDMPERDRRDQPAS